ncbi:hypothetical protein LINPERPRIM_LOCUS19568 [Linum perenne]
MALFLSRANRRPLTSPYRIHQLISQSSPLSTVSPGNDNTSSTAAADSQRQGLSFEDIYHRKVQDGSGQIGFQSLREELESLRTSNTNNAKGGSTFPWRINGSKISKSPFSDLTNSIQKLSESANEKKRGPIGSYNRGVQDGSAQIGFGTVKESLKSLRTTINADNAKGGSTSPWSSRGRNVDAYSAMLKGMEYYPYVDLRQCLLYLGVDYKSLMPSQSTPDYALHPPKDEFVERYFQTFKPLEKQGTELDSARVEGMSYNASTGQVTAEEEVWSLAAKAVEEEEWTCATKHSVNAVKQFREKGCPEYPKLCSLFEDTFATEAKDEISVDSANVKEVSKTAKGKMKCKLTAPVQKKLETEISRDSDDAKDVSKTAEGKMKCKVTAHARKKSETVESLLDCMALLQDMEIKDAEFTKALDILRTIIDFRQCFLRMNDKRRLGWVRNLDIVKRD